MTIQYLAYRGVSPLSKSIRWQTRGQYSHIAIHNIETNQVVEALAGPTRKDFWRRNGKVYLADSPSQYHTPGTYIDTLTLKDPEFPHDEAWAHALTLVETPYDYRGVIRFVSRRAMDVNGKLFCSEAATENMIAVGHKPTHLKPHVVSPRDFGSFICFSVNEFAMRTE